MIALLCFVLAVLAAPFKSKSRLETENAVLRHQLIILRRKMQGRARLTNSDRWFLIQLYRWFSSILNVLTIIRPETLVRWHRAGFRCYWRWKSRSWGGRPQIETDLRALIRRMSIENPLCGAPRIHGELLKLGFEVARPTDRGVPLERGAAPPHPRPGSDIQQHCHTPVARRGHPGQANCTGFTLAEWLCRTVDRIDPTRVCGSFYRLRRGASAPHPANLRSLLQSHQNAPVIGQ
jgi:hypothetical protein